MVNRHAPPLAALLLAACAAPTQAGSPSSSAASTWHDAYPPGVVSRSAHRTAAPRVHAGPSTRAATKATPSPRRWPPVPGFNAWATSRSTWRVFNCESHWNPRDVSAGGKYRGLIQADAMFWASWGGLKYAATPDAARVSEQLTVAYSAFRKRGWTPWPTCGRLA